MPSPHRFVGLLIKLALCMFEFIIQLPRPAMKLFRMILPVNLEHTVAFHECLERISRIDPHVRPILRVEAGFGTRLVLSKLSFSFCPSLRISLYLVSVFLEWVEVRLVVLTILSLHTRPLLILSPTEILSCLFRVGLPTPLFVMIRRSESSFELSLMPSILWIKSSAAKRIVVVGVFIEIRLVLPFLLAFLSWFGGSPVEILAIFVVVMPLLTRVLTSRSPLATVKLWIVVVKIFFVFEASVEEVILRITTAPLALAWWIASLILVSSLRSSAVIGSSLLCLHTKRIVLLTLILVHKHLIRVRDRLELLDHFWVIACLIGMVLLGHLVVSEFNFFGICVSLYS